MLATVLTAGTACRKSEPSPPAERAKPDRPAAASDEPAAPAVEPAGRATPDARAREDPARIRAAALADLARRFPPGKNCTIEAVQAAVQPHRDDVTACYREALLRNPELGGKLKLRLVVDALGSAETVEVMEREGLEDEPFGACVVGVMQRAVYAPAAADRPCTVVYPYDLQASELVRRQLRERLRRP